MESQPLKLYLGSVPGNLSSDALAQELKPQLSSFVHVETVKRVGRDKVVRNKGFAFLTLWDPQEYHDLVSQKKILRSANRVLKISEYKLAPNYPKQTWYQDLKKVFIKNIPVWAKEEDLMSAFVAAGLKPQIVSTGHSTKKKTECGFAEFLDLISAKHAIQVGKILLTNNRTEKVVLEILETNVDLKQVQLGKVPEEKGLQFKPSKNSNLDQNRELPPISPKIPQLANFTTHFNTMAIESGQPSNYSSLISYEASLQAAVSNNRSHMQNDLTAFSPEIHRFSVRPPPQSRERRIENLSKSPEGLSSYASNPAANKTREQIGHYENLLPEYDDTPSDLSKVYLQNPHDKKYKEPVPESFSRLNEFEMSFRTQNAQEHRSRSTEIWAVTQSWRQHLKTPPANQHPGNLRFNIHSE